METAKMRPKNFTKPTYFSTPYPNGTNSDVTQEESSIQGSPNDHFSGQRGHWVRGNGPYLDSQAPVQHGAPVQGTFYTQGESRYSLRQHRPFNNGAGTVPPYPYNMPPPPPRSNCGPSNRLPYPYPNCGIPYGNFPNQVHSNNGFNQWHQNSAAHNVAKQSRRAFYASRPSNGQCTHPRSPPTNKNEWNGLKHPQHQNTHEEQTTSPPLPASKVQSSTTHNTQPPSSAAQDLLNREPLGDEDQHQNTEVTQPDSLLSTSTYASTVYCDLPQTIKPQSRQIASPTSNEVLEPQVPPNTLPSTQGDAEDEEMAAMAFGDPVNFIINVITEHVYANKFELLATDVLDINKAESLAKDSEEYGKDFPSANPTCGQVVQMMQNFPVERLLQRVVFWRRQGYVADGILAHLKRYLSHDHIEILHSEEECGNSPRVPSEQEFQHPACDTKRKEVVSPAEPAKSPLAAPGEKSQHLAADRKCESVIEGSHFDDDNDDDDDDDEDLPELHRTANFGNELRMKGEEAVLFVFAEKDIDSRGGELNVAGVTLTIPPGALTKMETIKLGVPRMSSTYAPQLKKTRAKISPIVSCEPHGLKFLKEASLTMPHCAVNLKKNWKGYSVGKSETSPEENPNWEFGPVTPAASDTERKLTIAIEGFTLYTIIGHMFPDKPAAKLMELEAFLVPSLQAVEVSCANYYPTGDEINCNNLMKALEACAKGLMENGNIGKKTFMFESDGGNLCIDVADLPQGWALRNSQLNFESIWHSTWTSCQLQLEATEDKADVITNNMINLNFYQEMYKQLTQKNISVTTGPVSPDKSVGVSNTDASGLGQTVRTLSPHTRKSDKGVFVEKEIDCRGGEINIKGVTLTVPPGALHDPVMIRIGVLENNSHPPDLQEDQVLMSPVVSCEPHGLEFHKPVQLTIPQHMSKNTDSSEAKKGNDPDPPGTESTVGIEIQHFSYFGIIGNTSSGKSAVKLMQLRNFRSQLQDPSSIQQTLCSQEESKIEFPLLGGKWCGKTSMSESLFSEPERSTATASGGSAADWIPHKDDPHWNSKEKEFPVHPSSLYYFTQLATEDVLQYVITSTNNMISPYREKHKPSKHGSVSVATLPVSSDKSDGFCDIDSSGLCQTVRTSSPYTRKSDKDAPYPMDLPRLGHAVIIASEMPGSKEDVETVKTAFEALGFDVLVFSVPTAQELKMLKKRIMRYKIHEDSNTFCPTIIIHGSDQGHRPRKHETSLEELVGYFRRVKTNFFVVQSCGTGWRDCETLGKLPQDEDQTPPHIADKADIYICCATVPGYRVCSGDDRQPISQHMHCFATCPKYERKKRLLDLVLFGFRQELIACDAVQHQLKSFQLLSQMNRMREQPMLHDLQLSKCELPSFPVISQLHWLQSVDLSGNSLTSCVRFPDKILINLEEMLASCYKSCTLAIKGQYVGRAVLCCAGKSKLLKQLVASWAEETMKVRFFISSSMHKGHLEKEEQASSTEKHLPRF